MARKLISTLKRVSPRSTGAHRLAIVLGLFAAFFGAIAFSAPEFKSLRQQRRTAEAQESQLGQFSLRRRALPEVVEVLTKGVEFRPVAASWSMTEPLVQSNTPSDALKIDGSAFWIHQDGGWQKWPDIETVVSSRTPDPSVGFFALLRPPVQLYEPDVWGDENLGRFVNSVCNSLESSSYQLGQEACGWFQRRPDRLLCICKRLHSGMSTSSLDGYFQAHEQGLNYRAHYSPLDHEDVGNCERGVPSEVTEVELLLGVSEPTTVSERPSVLDYSVLAVPPLLGFLASWASVIILTWIVEGFVGDWRKRRAKDG